MCVCYISCHRYLSLLGGTELSVKVAAARWQINNENIFLVGHVDSIRHHNFLSVGLLADELASSLTAAGVSITGRLSHSQKSIRIQSTRQTFENAEHRQSQPTRSKRSHRE